MAIGSDPERILFAVVFQDDKVFSSCRVEGQMGESIFSRDEIKIVQLRFQILCILTEYYPVAGAVLWSSTHKAKILTDYGQRYLNLTAKGRAIA